MACPPYATRATPHAARYAVPWAANHVASTMTLDQMTNDGIELAEFLKTSLAKDKIILVGHSFGSILGVLLAKARPDLF